jgi:hypothetical protein
MVPYGKVERERRAICELELHLGDGTQAHIFKQQVRTSYFMPWKHHIHMQYFLFQGWLNF